MDRQGVPAGGRGRASAGRSSATCAGHAPCWAGGRRCLCGSPLRGSARRCCSAPWAGPGGGPTASPAWSAWRCWSGSRRWGAGPGPRGWPLWSPPSCWARRRRRCPGRRGRPSRGPGSRGRWSVCLAPRPGCGRRRASCASACRSPPRWGSWSSRAPSPRRARCCSPARWPAGATTSAPARCPARPPTRCGSRRGRARSRRRPWTSRSTRACCGRWPWVTDPACPTRRGTCCAAPAPRTCWRSAACTSVCWPARSAGCAGSAPDRWR